MAKQTKTKPLAASPKPKPAEPKLVARCIMDHTWTMTPEQIKEASVFGCAMCPICGNAATVEKVSLKSK